MAKGKGGRKTAKLPATKGSAFTINNQRPTIKQAPNSGKKLKNA